MINDIWENVRDNEKLSFATKVMIIRFWLPYTSDGPTYNIFMWKKFVIWRIQIYFTLRHLTMILRFIRTQLVLLDHLTFLDFEV